MPVSSPKTKSNTPSSKDSPTNEPASTARPNLGMSPDLTEPQMVAEVRNFRTPSDLKWLVNERASVHGAIRAQEVRLAKLEAKHSRRENQLEIAKRDCLRASVGADRLKANLQALDTAIALVHQDVNPSCAGSVHAWAGRYGERGALTAFVRTTLQACAPNELTMTVLLDLAAKNFGQTFVVPRERQSFRKSVRSALHALHVKNLIEPLHDKSAHGQWRWKAPISSLEALQEQARAQGLPWR